ncbi:MAG: GNAT family N-acetyltransferase, partial [Candidatus Hodarchaeota archaeon]
HNGMCLEFELCDRIEKYKVNPILRLARPDDAESIVEIYKELYNGTYPYKEMEDVDEVRKMIGDPNIQWIIYQDPSYNLAGCITFVLDFDNKRGYIRGFMLKKKYQGYVDITKAMIGSMIGMIHKFRDRIYIWYVENRTAHSKSQYSMWVCGIAPIGFCPNKDVFLGKIESDLMQICYDEKVLRELRASKVPLIIPQVEKCFLYSNNRYDLGNCQINDPQIALNKKKISQIKKKIVNNINKDKFGYETIKFSIPNTDSYFEFLYTPRVQNFEKTKYKVDNLEELYVFVQEFVKYGKKLGIRYCEAFISAYEPAHQKIFQNAGLFPRGYVPSWKYNKDKKTFEDCVLFNFFEGNISNEIQLISEGQELLQVLGIKPSNISVEIKEKEERFPLAYTIKKRFSNVWNFPKIIKSCLMVGLLIYLILLVGSIILAYFFGPSGYNILDYAISQLGSSKITPIPSMFDSACIIGGITTILLYGYLSKRFEGHSFKKSKKNELINKFQRYGLIIGIMGSIGIACVGLFSLDRAGPQGIWHSLSSIIAFTGYILSLLIFGIHIFKFSTEIPKILGLNGILPIVVSISHCIFASPFLEWVLLISILTSLFPIFYWLLFR